MKLFHCKHNPQWQVRVAVCCLPSRSSVPVKVDLLSAKMQNKNSRNAHRLIY